MAGPRQSVAGGRYLLRQRVGAGGMGEVWLAEDQFLPRRVAVKRLLDLQTGGRLDPGNIERAMREARSVAQLNHPNAVSLLDLIVENGQPYLIMEFVDGTTLGQLAFPDGVAPALAARLIGQVASALSAAHEVGIVHRDVKPSNVLITHRNVAKLADFGIARSTTDVTVTATGLVIGSLGYMAPEVADGQVATSASDVWSLGATLFAATEGRSPFEGPSTAAVLANLLFKPIPVPQRAGALTDVVRRMLTREPSARPSAEQVVDELAGLSLAPPPTNPVWTPPTRTPGGPEHRDEQQTVVGVADTPGSAAAEPAGFGAPVYADTRLQPDGPAVAPVYADTRLQPDPTDGGRTADVDRPRREAVVALLFAAQAILATVGLFAPTVTGSSYALLPYEVDVRADLSFLPPTFLLVIAIGLLLTTRSALHLVAVGTALAVTISQWALILDLVRAVSQSGAGPGFWLILLGAVPGSVAVVIVSARHRGAAGPLPRPGLVLVAGLGGVIVLVNFFLVDQDGHDATAFRMDGFSIAFVLSPIVTVLIASFAVRVPMAAVGAVLALAVLVLTADTAAVYHTDAVTDTYRALLVLGDALTVIGGGLLAAAAMRAQRVTR